MVLKVLIAGHADSYKVVTRAAERVCPCNHSSTIGLFAVYELAGWVSGLFGSLRFMGLAHGVRLFVIRDCATVRFALGELSR